MPLLSFLFSIRGTTSERQKVGAGFPCPAAGGLLNFGKPTTCPVTTSAYQKQKRGLHTPANCFCRKFNPTLVQSIQGE